MRNSVDFEQNILKSDMYDGLNINGAICHCPWLFYVVVMFFIIIALCWGRAHEGTHWYCVSWNPSKYCTESR
jgi:predicted ABC-type sugar transport system permease subunit